MFRGQLSRHPCPLAGGPARHVCQQGELTTFSRYTWPSATNCYGSVGTMEDRSLTICWSPKWSDALDAFGLHLSHLEFLSERQQRHVVQRRAAQSSTAKFLAAAHDATVISGPGVSGMGLTGRSRHEHARVLEVFISVVSGHCKEG